MFNDFSDDSKCWVFGFKNSPNSEQVQNISKMTNTYLQTWKSHGKAISSSHEVLENRFLVIVAQGSSGCSIDSMRKEVSNILETNNVELSNFTDVFWRSKQEINCSNRQEFSNLVNQDTEIDSVYDLSLSSVGSLKQNGLSKSYKDSWAFKAFS